MDPIGAIGLIGSCANIVQMITKIYSFARKSNHSSKSTSRELVALLGRLNLYEGLIKGIKFQAELEQVIRHRLSTLNHVNGPLEGCKSATAPIKHNFETLPKYVHFGRKVDKGISVARGARNNPEARPRC